MQRFSDRFPFSKIDSRRKDQSRGKFLRPEYVHQFFQAGRYILKFLERQNLQSGYEQALRNLRRFCHDHIARIRQLYFHNAPVFIGAYPFDETLRFKAVKDTYDSSRVKIHSGGQIGYSCLLYTSPSPRDS